MADGVYFLDCRRGEETKSTLGYYNNNLVPFGNNGQFPDAISDIRSGFIVWESGRDESHTFSDGVVLRWLITSNAASANPGDVVGTASNGFREFKVFKDRTRELFQTGDGFICTTVYYAH